MGDYKQVVHARLYLKEPNTERIRKTSAGRLKALLASGWRETDRWNRGEFIEVRLERTGVPPLRARLPKAAPEVRLERRRGRGDRGPRR